MEGRTFRFLVTFRTYPSDCPACEGTGSAHVHDPQRPLSGKMTMRAESAEGQAGMDGFREHVNSPQRGRKYEIVFRNREMPAPNGPMPPQVQIAGITETGDVVRGRDRD